MTLVRELVSKKRLSIRGASRVSKCEYAASAIIGSDIHEQLNHHRVVYLKGANCNIVRLANVYSHLLELVTESTTTEMNLGSQNVYGVDITGIVDRLEIVGSDLRVIDIKTHPGKYFTPGSLPKHISKYTSYMHALQVNIYAVMVEQLLHDDVLFASLYEPVGDEQLFRVHHDIVAQFQDFTTHTTYSDLYERCCALRNQLRSLKLVPVIYHISQSSALSSICTQLPNLCTENRLAYRKKWLENTLVGHISRSVQKSPVVPTLDRWIRRHGGAKRNSKFYAIDRHKDYARTMGAENKRTTRFGDSGSVSTY
jgi:hypothetical protein